jgi:LysM repeat protein
MVANCGVFYFTKSGDNCEAIATTKGITVAQFITWNPQVGGTACSGLWVGVNVCVSIIGHTPTTTTASPTNGIATPTPTQPGMVSNCDLFYLTKTGDTCASIAAAKGITVTQFTTWNTQVGGTACTGLWVGVNV